MSKADLNMKDLLGMKTGKNVAIRQEQLENAKSAAALKNALAKKSKLIRWDSVKDVLAEKTIDMLDLPIARVLFPAWKKYREIMEFADARMHPPDETSLVALAEHTVKTEHHPYLQISYQGFQFPKLEFTLRAELTLQGIVLCIQDGKIKEIKEGTMKGKAALLLEDESIVETPFGSYELPGHFDLGDGISLRDFDT
jgi:hypothetical protein